MHVRPWPTRSPFSGVGSCQTALKRTLKFTAWGTFRIHRGILHSAIIVNRPLPQTVAIFLTSAQCRYSPGNDRSLASPKTQEIMIGSCFLQIFSKLYFLELSENLRRI